MTTPFWRRALVAATTALALVTLALLVWRLADVLLLGFAGVLFAVFLRTCAEPVRRATRLPEGWALAVVGLGLLGLTVLSGWLLLPSLLAQAGGFLARLPDLVSRLEAALTEIPFLNDALQGTSSLSGVADRASALLLRAFSTLSSTFGALANVLLVLITGIFLAAEPKLYRHDLVRLVPPASRERAQGVLDKLGRTLRAWLFGQLLDMTFVAVLVSLGVWIIGLPYALALGVAAGLLDFIPFIGPVLGVAPALLLALAGGSTSQVVWVLIVYMVVQQLEGNLFQPLIQERAVSIPPAVQVLSLVAFGALFGFLGLIVATPVTAVIIVLVRELYVKPLEETPGVLDDRPERL